MNDITDTIIDTNSIVIYEYIDYNGDKSICLAI